MIAKFWEAVGGGLADRWRALGAGALVFWFGIVIAWYFGRSSRADVGKKADTLARTSTAVQIVLLLSAFGVVAASAIVVRHLVPAVLAILQGPWRGPIVGRLSRYLLRKKADKAVRLRAKHAEVADASNPGLRLEQVDLEGRIRRYPTDTFALRPTRVGNSMQAVSSVLFAKYGLDVAIVWPRLWLILPESSRQELVTARAALDMAVAASIWAVLYCCAFSLNVLAPVVGAVVLACTVLIWIPDRAEAFADLIESTVDMHRAELHEKLRLPLPASIGSEVDAGVALTRYLLRGEAPAEQSAVAVDDTQATTQNKLVHWIRNVCSK